MTAAIPSGSLHSDQKRVGLTMDKSIARNAGKPHPAEQLTGSTFGAARLLRNFAACHRVCRRWPSVALMNEAHSARVNGKMMRADYRVDRHQGDGRDRQAQEVDATAPEIPAER
jgi:hypothetical protein